MGQYTVVMPDQDAVVSINAGLGRMDHELNLVWKYLLPAMKAEGVFRAWSEKLTGVKHGLQIPNSSHS